MIDPAMLTSPQQNVLQALSQNAVISLKGPAGCGKTTVACYHLRALASKPLAASQTLVLIPQRSLASPYTEIMQDPAFGSSAVPTVLTIHGLAQRTISLFWTILPDEGWFLHPEKPPVFLTLETSQYYLAQIAARTIDEKGYFQNLHIQRPRLYSQILDNLNKSALLGFSLEELTQRLISAWNGESGHTIIYEQAHEIARSFRSFCYKNNLLDFSLQLDIFARFLANHPLVTEYFRRQYAHLIYDNMEEDGPVAHELVEGWLPYFNTALLIEDEHAGYRSFMGADPHDLKRFEPYIHQTITCSSSFQTSGEIQSFCTALKQSIQHKTPLIEQKAIDACQLHHSRLLPAMIQAVSDEVARLVQSGIPPRQIAILNPILNDTLRFSLVESLKARSIPSYSARPSRPLNAEPAVNCLLTLAILAHPQWDLALDSYAFRQTLMIAIDNLDMIRASILSETVFRTLAGRPELSPFSRITNPKRLEQITWYFGGQYEVLRQWLEQYRQQPPDYLDSFISRLFGEVLSQKGFGFHSSLEMASVTKRLMESIQKFRKVISSFEQDDTSDIGRRYVQMIRDGVVAAQYLLPESGRPEAVLIAPAYTFLMGNHPVDYQFWLDIGNLSWSERIDQPLTHPYVLSRNWTTERRWTHQDEVQVAQDNLDKITAGLAARCGKKIYLYSCGINEQGQEQSSPFLTAMQRISRAVCRKDRESPYV